MASEAQEGPQRETEGPCGLGCVCWQEGSPGTEDCCAHLCYCCPCRCHLGTPGSPGRSPAGHGPGTPRCHLELGCVELSPRLPLSLGAGAGPLLEKWQVGNTSVCLAIREPASPLTLPSTPPATSAPTYRLSAARSCRRPLGWPGSLPWRRTARRLPRCPCEGRKAQPCPATGLRPQPPAAQGRCRAPRWWLTVPWLAAALSCSSGSLCLHVPLSHTISLLSGHQGHDWAIWRGLQVGAVLLEAT